MTESQGQGAQEAGGAELRQGEGEGRSQNAERRSADADPDVEPPMNTNERR